LKTGFWIARLVLILGLPFLLVSASLAWGFNSRWLYNYGFEKYAVSEQTGFSPVELDKAAQGLIDYFNSKDEYVDIILIQDGKPVDLFNGEEKIHFQDVKGLIWFDYRILLISFILALACFLINLLGKKGLYRRDLAKSLIWGCGLTLFVIIGLGISSFFDFDQLFLQLHYWLFTNQYWSAPGYMLLLFPGGFWYDAALFCLAFMAFWAIVLGGGAALYLKRNSRKIR
jgi:integral membrane protein (TIGR01906 family)